MGAGPATRAGEAGGSWITTSDCSPGLSVSDRVSSGPPAGVTEIVTNPPMGRRVQRGDVAPLLGEFLASAGALLQPGGRLVWISPFPRRARDVALATDAMHCHKPPCLGTLTTSEAPPPGLGAPEPVQLAFGMPALDMAEEEQKFGWKITVPLSKAAVEAHKRAELALRNLAAAGRIAKVTTREVAKSGNHAVLVLPDAHFPFNDEAACDIAVQIARIVRPTRIVSLGDTIEAAAWTAHPPRSVPEEATHKFSHEIETAGAWIDRVRDAAGTSPSWAYLEGNHEAHIERECLRLGAIGRAVSDLVSPRNLLTRGRPWMSWTPYVEPYAKERRPTAHLRGGGMAHHKICSDLWAVHGWSIAKHVAQKHLELARTFSVIAGHSHRVQSVTERILDTGKLVRAWSSGCLSNLQPAWHHGSPTTWSHAVSLVYCEDACLTKIDPKWEPYVIAINRGEAVLPGGTSVRA